MGREPPASSICPSDTAPNRPSPSGTATSCPPSQPCVSGAFPDRECPVTAPGSGHLPCARSAAPAAPGGPGGDDGLMAVKPVLLVHGAWHGGWCWGPVQTALAGRGVRAVAVDLPGHGDDHGALGDLHGDAARVRAALDTFD